MRSGYFTGIRCHRNAKWVVTLFDESIEVSSTDRLCTQHKSINVGNLERSGYLKRNSHIKLTVEEIPK